jgi:hypothetical protein
MKILYWGGFFFTFQIINNADKIETIRSSRVGFLEDYTRDEQAIMMNARPILYPSAGVVIVRPPLMGFKDEKNIIEQAIMSHEERVVLRKCFHAVQKAVDIRMPLCISKINSGIIDVYSHYSIHQLRAIIKKQRLDDSQIMRDFLRKDRSARGLDSADTESCLRRERDRAFDISRSHLFVFLAKMKHKQFFIKHLHKHVTDAVLSLEVLKKVSLADAYFMATVKEMEYEDIKPFVKRVLIGCSLALLFERSIHKHSDVKEFFLKEIEERS